MLLHSGLYQAEAPVPHRERGLSQVLQQLHSLSTPYAATGNAMDEQAITAEQQLHPMRHAPGYDCEKAGFTVDNRGDGCACRNELCPQNPTVIPHVETRYAANCLSKRIIEVQLISHG